MGKTASSTYNPQLAHMLIAVSNSVYSASDMEKTFERFGFEKKNTLRNEDALLNYSIGLKSIGDETLVLISIRGTGGLGDDIWSWASNVSATVDLKGQHLGFSTTTNSLYKKLDEFISNRSSGSGKVTYVITGFSRGAAVTNLLAARLLSKGVSKSDLYAYAFACPDTIISTKDLTIGYECIFNIADVNDLVSWAPQTLWGFSNNWTKYGQSYWFSRDWNDYKNLEMVNEDSS